MKNPRTRSAIVFHIQLRVRFFENYDLSLRIIELKIFKNLNFLIFFNHFILFDLKLTYH